MHFVAVRFFTRTPTHKTVVIIIWVLVGLSFVKTLMVLVPRSCPGDIRFDAFESKDLHSRNPTIGSEMN